MASLYGTVEYTEWLTPSMVRVIFGGDGLAGFEPTAYTDQYVNALFTPPGSILSVPFDIEKTRTFESDLRPRGRRFTVRRWDTRARRMTMDFVAHGDTGFAGRWAQVAQPGDRLQMVGPTGSYRPDPDSDWHLMVGDESALPAVAASLEVLPPGRRCVVLLVVDDAEHEVPLSSPADLEVNWLHRRSSTEPADLLRHAAEDLAWRDGSVDVFAHGEAGEIRSLRRHLLNERGVEKERSSISPYWRRHHTDEAWRELKAQWLTEQEADT